MKSKPQPKSRRSVDQELGFLKAIVEGDPFARFAYADWLSDEGRQEEADKQRELVGFSQIVEMPAAWDKRSDTPSEDYGVHGVDLRMVLVGPLGAVQFVVYTNWMLPHVQSEWVSRFADEVEAHEDWRQTIQFQFRLALRTLGITHRVLATRGRK